MSQTPSIAACLPLGSAYEMTVDRALVIATVLRSNRGGRFTTRECDLPLRIFQKDSFVYGTHELIGFQMVFSPNHYSESLRSSLRKVNPQYVMHMQINKDMMEVAMAQLTGLDAKSPVALLVHGGDDNDGYLKMALGLANKLGIKTLDVTKNRQALAKNLKPELIKINKNKSILRDQDDYICPLVFDKEFHTAGTPVFPDIPL